MKPWFKWKEKQEKQLHRIPVYTIDPRSVHHSIRTQCLAVVLCGVYVPCCPDTSRTNA